MPYQPIKVIAAEQITDGKVNRETDFDATPQTNRINYQTGLPYMTATPKSLGGKGPRRVDLNGIFYLFSSNLFELQQGNYPTYNAAVVGSGKPLPSGYPLGAVLWYPAGGYFVRSLVADNTESDLTNTTKWAKITVSAADLLQAVPTGSVQPYAGASIPAGWLLCDGSAVSRTDYAALFAAIGTLYGTGDGSTTFNLPDFTDKTFWGGTAGQAGTVKTAGLPNITGECGQFGGENRASNNNAYYSTNFYDYPWANVDGAIGIKLGAKKNTGAEGSNGIDRLYINAANSNSIYGNSETVQPPAIQVPFIIKY